MEYIFLNIICKIKFNFIKNYYIHLPNKLLIRFFSNSNIFIFYTLLFIFLFPDDTGGNSLGEFGSI